MSAARPLRAGIVDGQVEAPRASTALPLAEAAGSIPLADAAALPSRPRISVPRFPSALGTERTRARLGIAGLLIAASVIAVGAARTGSLLPQSVRPVPAPLGGAFDAIAVDLHPGGVIAALALMFASYAAVVALSGRLTARAVIATVLALHALVLLAPPLVSTDIFSYQAYARMGSLYAINPYTHGPYAIGLDSVFPYVGAKWSYTPSVYGPLFTVFSYLIAPLSVAASVFAYKSLAAVSSLALIAVVWRGARLRDRDPVRAVAIVGCNPLLIVYGVGGGHNDLVMLLAMVGAVYALIASRERIGGMLGMLAVGLKLTAGLILPFALAAPDRREAARRRDLALGVAAGTVSVLAVGFGVFGTGLLQMFATLDKAQTEGGDSSFPGFVAARLGLPGVGHRAGFALAAVFALVCVWLLRRVWRGRLDWIDGSAWAMIAMLLATGSLLPWYVSWLLPLVALARDRRLLSAAMTMTGVVLCIQLIGYVPHYRGLF